MYIPATRTDQLTFFLGYASRIKRSRYAVVKAIDDVERIWNITFPYDKVFEYCPQNNNFDALLSSYHRVENNTKMDLSSEIYETIKEFLFLKSDFFPPCCGDGFTEYFLNRNNEIILVCDKCDKCFDLYGIEINCGVTRKMTRTDFASILGEETQNIWPHHHDLASLLQRAGITVT